MPRCLPRVLALAASLVVLPASAQQGIAHITSLKGKVNLRHGDSGSWIPATVNAPLAADDFVSTEPGARVHIQLDSFHTVNLESSGEVRMVQSDYERYQMELERGRMLYRVLGSSAAISTVDTPSVSVAPSLPGAFRIGVGRDGVTEIAAQAGDVMVFAPTGSMWVSEGQKLLARGSRADPEYRIWRQRRTWRRMAQILANVQIAAAVGAFGGSESTSSQRETKSNNASKNGTAPRATPHPSQPHQTGGPAHAATATHGSTPSAVHNSGGSSSGSTSHASAPPAASHTPSAPSSPPPSAPSAPAKSK